MTVAELIVKLQEMPPTADVIYRFFSDWVILSEEQVRLKTAKESEAWATAENVHPMWRKSPVICFQDGQYKNTDSFLEYSKNELPVYKDVVTLPGN